MHLISNMRSARNNNLVLLLNVIDQIIRNRLDPAYNPTFQRYYLDPYYYGRQISPLDLVVRALYCAWTNSPLKSAYVYDFSSTYEKIENSGYIWICAELAKNLLSNENVVNLKRKKFEETISEAEKCGIHQFLFDAKCKVANWKRTVDNLINFIPHELPSPKTKTKHKSKTKSRLVWFISVNNGSCDLTPKEQVLGAKGQYSRGKPISLNRLKEKGPTLGFLTSQDIELCSCINIKTYFSRGYPKTDSFFDTGKALKIIIDHPLVFSEDAVEPVGITKGLPELSIIRDKQNLRLSFIPKIANNDSLWVEQVNPNLVKVYDLDYNQLEIAQNLRDEVIAPISGLKHIQKAIKKISGIVTIQTDVEGATTEGPASEIEADRTLHVQLRPIGNGLKIQIMVRPFGNRGPYFRPGKGGTSVIASVDGKNIQSKRDLSYEQELCLVLIKNCPALNETGSYDWHLDDLEDALDFLQELNSFVDQAKDKSSHHNHKIVIEWPEGKSISLTNPISTDSMHYRIKKDTDWFEANGKLVIDKTTTLELQKLLELVNHSSTKFIALSQNRYLHLTDNFRRMLNELNVYSEKSKNGIKIHSLAALALGDFTEGAKSVKADKSWSLNFKRLDEVETLRPEVPSTFQGELRDYQVEGTQWLMRLAHLRVGACLADDMGLGKTIQALAFILSRAHEGPTLVIAPTSVSFNWSNETERFAPTLNPIFFASSQRQKVISSLKPYDILICSYGLLSTETKSLSKVKWKTVILDEAQAIKNATTKRSKAAMSLQGEFKMLLTGTPIENHLGELWNLFRFINPGLLGPETSFTQKFTVPIEQKNDRNQRIALKKLIQPFTLRRLKTQVLNELPEKTEIVLHVELSTEEASFYEALRLNALENISNSEANEGQQSMKILAEITRLRQACCNPRLVTPEVDIPSSKMELISEIITELVENNHKALVFSQFVGHLSIVREYLENLKGDQKIGYQYLDGKTPAKERVKSIDAFQAGQGNLFLISLRAGGLGLNLTAADYVLHLDPWWNPAVEDQASDRAHRIGQHRPVTVYRFVTRNTIEEKIIDLHSTKRNLAGDLLSGSDKTGKISTKELLKLIRKGPEGEVH